MIETYPPNWDTKIIVVAINSDKPYSSSIMMDELTKHVTLKAKQTIEILRHHVIQIQADNVVQTLGGALAIIQVDYVINSTKETLLTEKQ